MFSPGKVLNPEREEVDDEVVPFTSPLPFITVLQLKEELVEAKGINRIFDDSDKNRNHIGWLGTMAQTYFPRFFTPDDDDDDEEEDGDDGGEKDAGNDSKGGEQPKQAGCSDEAAGKKKSD